MEDFSTLSQWVPMMRMGALGAWQAIELRPEVQARVLVAQANVPHQQVHCSVRQEKLKQTQNKNVPSKFIDNAN